MRPGLISIVMGVWSEVVVLVSLIPRDSTRPPTAWQTVVGYTQLPAVSLANALTYVVDRFPYAIPPPLRTIGALVTLGAEFLVQVAIFSAIWFVAITSVRGRNFGKPHEA